MKKYILLSLFYLIFFADGMAEEWKEEGSLAHVIKTIHERYPHYELVYVNFSGKKMDLVLVNMESNFASGAMSAKRMKDVSVDISGDNVPYLGEFMSIDGLEDTRLPVFKEQYCSISSVFKLLNRDFLFNHHLGQDWKIAKIGYVDIRNKEKPFTWGITFVRKTGNQVKQKSFVLEEQTLKVVENPLKEFCFEGLLTDW